MTNRTTDIELRTAATADRDRIAEIWHAGASLPGVGPAALPSREVLRDEVDKAFDAGWQVAVAARGDEIVGFAAVKPRERVLAELFVDPAMIGGGIGTRLFAWVREALPDGFTLFTRPANLRACRFYERQGLRVLRTDTHPRFGDPIVFYGT